MNSDAQVLDNCYRVLGVVIGDDEGMTLVAVVRRVNAKWNYDISEAKKAIFSVELSHKFGYHNVTKATL